MKPLSQRLEEAANAWPTVYESDRANIALLREAAALAKRYEDAPVVVIGTLLKFVDVDLQKLRSIVPSGKPVRIILDNQENE